jgi:Domain of unknown function (DUF4149)
VISRYRLEQGAAVFAVVSLGIWVGGLVALGACAAPIVFHVVPAPLSGDAMGAVFRRFDFIAIACGVVVLACEAVRIYVASATPSGAKVPAADRARTALAVVAAAAAIYGGTQLSPQIVALHVAGAVRGFGADGGELERLHALAETVAKIEVSAGLILLALQVTTLRRVEERARGPIRENEAG